MSIAESERMRQLQEQVLDLMRRVADLEQQAKDRQQTLRLPKDKS